MKGIGKLLVGRTMIVKGTTKVLVKLVWFVPISYLHTTLRARQLTTVG